MRADAPKFDGKSVRVTVEEAGSVTWILDSGPQVELPSITFHYEVTASGEHKLVACNLTPALALSSPER